MKYFTHDLTGEQIKSEYRRLCKQYHPDLHPDDNSQNWVAIMQEINAEYATASATARRAEEPSRRASKGAAAPTDSEYADMADVDERIRAAIEKLIKFHFLEIEICGQWVWVDGTAKRGTNTENDAALDALMLAGYKWASNKKRWYFAGVPSGKHFRAWDMDEIRRTHGSVKVRTNEKDTEKRYTPIHA